jgi:hypothetical protein
MACKVEGQHVERGKGSDLAVQKPDGPAPDPPSMETVSTKWRVFGNFPE